METNETERTMTLEEVLSHIQEMTIEELIELQDSVDKGRKELQDRILNLIKENFIYWKPTHNLA